MSAGIKVRGKFGEGQTESIPINRGELPSGDRAFFFVEED
jgi:hypothetical protein